MICSSSLDTYDFYAVAVITAVGYDYGEKQVLVTYSKSLLRHHSHILEREYVCQWVTRQVFANATSS
ncbi:hypothetical protein L210DRAFT_3536213 [Boletus edulis BED1]|uniref:Uncharacterized protein n=1 Tax=Boletus edulis BED1 TaxID=1328754 RepID=A0AAD4BWV7_BOLED|nr:hypothetical protein L210DRAFT_3536213 [Boletus edulis BED1]